jgi:hypothetical protein
MKKLLVLSVFAFLISVALSAQVKAGGNAWVSSKQAELKSSTGVFGETRGVLQMAQQVMVLRINGNWAEVRSAANSSLSGWTAVNNLSSKRIISSGTGASVNEITMGGKGFNQEVENAYKANGSLNYADIDRTEAITISQDELYRFVTEGRLFTGE